MSEPKVTTSFALPRETADLVRRAALEHALRTGRRVSASALVADLIEANRTNLLRGAPTMQSEASR